jgi:transposase
MQESMFLHSSNVCVVDARGKIVREDKVASEPVALIKWFMSLGVRLERIGLEAGPPSQWLYGALHESGLPVELLETRHVKAALSAKPVKTDRNDARGVAFRPVHSKSMAAQEVRALLTARKLVQSKLYDIEMGLRGILRGFGLKVGRPHRRAFPRGSKPPPALPLPGFASHQGPVPMPIDS